VQGPRTRQRAASLPGGEAAAERKPRTPEARAARDFRGQHASWKRGANFCPHGVLSSGAWRAGAGWFPARLVLKGARDAEPGVAAADASVQLAPAVLGEVALGQSPPPR